MIDPFNPSRPPRLELKRGDAVFVCEGKDDCALVEHLTARWKFPPIVVTRNLEDKSDWNDQFRTIVQQGLARRIASIGVLFDAETNRRKSEKTIRNMFKAAEISPPSKAGLVQKRRVNGDTIKTGFFINPPGKSNGALETSFLPQVMESEIGGCLRKLRSCYRGIRRMKTIRENKVVVRTFLAHRRPYNTGLTLALAKSDLNCKRPEFEKLRKFIHLFAPPELPLFD